MKVTKEQLATNRAALVRAASHLFRSRGIDGVGVAEISKRAGLTHGALYAQSRPRTRWRRRHSRTALSGVMPT